MAAQGDTAHDLAAAGSDAGQLANVLAEHTGPGSPPGQRQPHGCGGFGDIGTGGGEVPPKISADGHGIELALNGSTRSPATGSGSRLRMLFCTQAPP